MKEAKIQKKRNLDSFLEEIKKYNVVILVKTGFKGTYFVLYKEVKKDDLKQTANLLAYKVRNCTYIN